MPHRHRTPMTGRERAQLRTFIQQKRHARRQQVHAARRAGRAVERDTSLDLGDEEDDYAPVGFRFSPRRHGLTPDQCRLAQQLLHKANRARPIPGAGQQAQFRRALRIAGIVSAVRNGRVGNSRWGRSMLGKLGGNVIRDHALAHLRRISPIGRQAAQAAREGRKALKAWERRQRHQQPCEEWQQEQMPKDFMAW